MRYESPKKPFDRSIRDRGAIVLLSCYELGQQPLGLAQANTSLVEAGFAPVMIDLDIDPLDEQWVRDAQLVAISVPMHTALRIAMGVARRVRELNPSCAIVFYGLYAALNSRHLIETIADACFGGEFEQPLVDFSRTLESNTQHPPHDPNSATPSAPRKTRPMRRDGIPPITRYTQLLHEGRYRTVGQVISTRGCKHLCAHCPLPAVYDGRFYAIPVETVLRDVTSHVESGAQHITFADPDFLNGPTHAARVVRAVHDEFPQLTFDFTAKIEHLLDHRRTVAELQRLNCLFVTSAVESLNARTLTALVKGHAPEDVFETIEFFGEIGLALRPTFVPFTPWDTRQDYRAILEMVERHGLIDNVDPVQYTIRLLVPPGSRLAESPLMIPHLGHLDDGRLTFSWTHPDAGMDALCRDVTALVIGATRERRDVRDTFFDVKALAEERRLDKSEWDAIHRRYPTERERAPRLTEAWFC